MDDKERLLNTDRILTEQTPKRGGKETKPFDIFDAYFDSSWDAFSDLSDSFVKKVERTDSKQIEPRMPMVFPPIIMTLMSSTLWLLVFIGFKYFIAKDINFVSAYLGISVVCTPCCYILIKMNSDIISPETSKQTLHLVLFSVLFSIGFFILSGIWMQYMTLTVFTTIFSLLPVILAKIAPWIWHDAVLRRINFVIALYAIGIVIYVWAWPIQKYLYPYVEEVIEDPENPQLPPESHSTHKFTYYIYGTLSATLGVLSLAFSLISLRSFNKHQAGTAVAPFYACLVFSIITVVYVIYNTSALSDILSSISEI